MRLGIVGLPNSSKTTLFNALTGQDQPTGAVSSGQIEVHTAVVNVPDERVTKLVDMYQPKKTNYATVTYSDIAGIDKGFGESGLSGQLKNELSQMDGFLHVVRAFEDDTVPHPYVTVDPQRDVETLNTEFLLSDLISVEKRLERLNDELRRGKKGEKEKLQEEIELMERLKAALEEEIPLRKVEISPEEEKQIRGFGFFTQKPMVIVFNTGDELRDPTTIGEFEETDGLRLVSLQGKIEAEIAQLEGEDADMFLEEYGIEEPSSQRVIRMSYELLKLHSFFTVGKDEVRAWSIPVGATAPEAAGAIHSDLQQGFIRAEVIPYADLIELGSEEAVKSAGKFRLEGKGYVVQDGDIVHIRHSK